MTSYAGNNVTLKLVGDLNAVAAAGEIDLGTPPDNFVCIAGYVACAQGTTNNEISVGDGTTANLFLDDESIASAALAGTVLTGMGTKFDGTKTVTVKNTGSAAIPSTATAVTVTLFGYMEHS